MCNDAELRAGQIIESEELLVSVKKTGTRVVIAAPVDNGDSLFEVIGTLPARCAAVALLAVPSFRIQSTVLTSRLAIRCLPLTVGRQEFRTAVEQPVGLREHREDSPAEDLPQARRRDAGRGRCPIRRATGARVSAILRRVAALALGVASLHGDEEDEQDGD